MAASSRIKSMLNKCIRPLGLRIDTLTTDCAERSRVSSLRQLGHFDRPVYPVPESFKHINCHRVFEQIHAYRTEIEKLVEPTRNTVGFSLQNAFFTSPDAEVLYTLIRTTAPRTVVEVGSGNSTKVIRQAICDGALNTRLIAIDPEPRLNVKSFVDNLYEQPVETVDRAAVFGSLQTGDVLFIDSSHKCKGGGDVPFLFLNVLPELARGVLIHIHDIFLPFEYPESWVLDFHPGIDEQYLVQGILMHSSDFEVVWAGHYLQHTHADFERYFPNLNGGMALSLWLRTNRIAPSSVNC